MFQPLTNSLPISNYDEIESTKVTDSKLAFSQLLTTFAEKRKTTEEQNNLFNCRCKRIVYLLSDQRLSGKKERTHESCSKPKRHTPHHDAIVAGDALLNVKCCWSVVFNNKRRSIKKAFAMAAHEADRQWWCGRESEWPQCIRCENGFNDREIAGVENHQFREWDWLIYGQLDGSQLAVAVDDSIDELYRRNGEMCDWCYSFDHILILLSKMLSG